MIAMGITIVFFFTHNPFCSFWLNSKWHLTDSPFNHQSRSSDSRKSNDVLDISEDVFVLLQNRQIGFQSGANYVQGVPLPFFTFQELTTQKP